MNAIRGDQSLNRIKISNTMITLTDGVNNHAVYRCSSFSVIYGFTVPYLCLLPWSLQLIISFAAIVVEPESLGTSAVTGLQ